MEETNIVFTYITNLEVDDDNIKKIIHMGRKRWKIENQGFNNQKNILLILPICAVEMIML